jgi:parvulin-like peptidyl-prolyl isomerase
MSRRLIFVALACLLVGAAVGGWVVSLNAPRPDRGLWTPREVDHDAFAVSHILVAMKKGRKPFEARALIHQAYKLLVDGQDFATVARGRSEDRSARTGGFLGFLTPQKDTTFAGVVQTLRPGAISPPFQSSIGWQIVKRHSFEEGRALERRWEIPALGIFIGWEGMPEGVAGRTREKAKAMAADVRTKIEKGEMTLVDAMKLYIPKDKQRADAFIAMVTDNDLTGELYDALKPLKPGQLAGPVETRSGWAILKRGRYLRSLFRHILIQHVRSRGRALGIGRTQEEALKLAKDVLAQALKDRSRWNELVERYSDDARSRMNGGSMGVLYPGSIPPGFEKVVYDMPPDTICPHVVESVFGYHILWKVD